jgi:hypothetical protein
MTMPTMLQEIRASRGGSVFFRTCCSRLMVGPVHLLQCSAVSVRLTLRWSRPFAQFARVTLEIRLLSGRKGVSWRKFQFQTKVIPHGPTLARTGRGVEPAACFSSFSSYYGRIQQQSTITSFIRPAIPWQVGIDRNELPQDATPRVWTGDTVRTVSHLWLRRQSPSRR